MRLLDSKPATYVVLDVTLAALPKFVRQGKFYGAAHARSSLPPLKPNERLFIMLGNEDEYLV